MAKPRPEAPTIPVVLHEPDVVVTPRDMWDAELCLPAGGSAGGGAADPAAEWMSTVVGVVEDISLLEVHPDEGDAPQFYWVVEFVSGEDPKLQRFDDPVAAALHYQKFRGTDAFAFMFYGAYMPVTVGEPMRIVTSPSTSIIVATGTVLETPVGQDEVSQDGYAGDPLLRAIGQHPPLIAPAPDRAVTDRFAKKNEAEAAKAVAKNDKGKPDRRKPPDTHDPDNLFDS